MLLKNVGIPMIEHILSGNKGPFDAPFQYMECHEPVLLVSGNGCSDDELRIVVEVDHMAKLPDEQGYSVTLGDVVFGQGTPAYKASESFDKNWRPKYDRKVAICSGWGPFRVSLIDLETGERLESSLDRMTRL